tara:strand:- start:43 stop:399 length:357 start_codon:yes stop_codon:yes gene_type:complete
MNIKGYFNESCNICRAEINHYKKINKSINWIDVIHNNCASRETNLSSKELIRRLHIIKNDELYKGLDAFIVVWNEIPRYKFLSKLLALPIIYHVGWLIYEFFAVILFYKNKHLLKKDH